MSNVPIPSAEGIVATLGIQPESIVVKALEVAKVELVAYLGKPEVEVELASGIFAFANQQFPAVMQNPIASGAEAFIIKLLQARAAKPVTP